MILVHAVAAVSLLLATFGADAQSRPTQHQVEAVFLFRFTQFVEWPSARAQNVPFCIGVLGKDRFGKVLADAVRDERVDSRPIVVRHFAATADAADCEIVFVSESERTRVPEIVRALEGRGTLTVADFDGFATTGGIIEFVVDDSRTRLRINLSAARAAGLAIDSKLLRAAEIVGPDK